MTPTTQPMSTEQSALLAEFARCCKSAARSVSLYPGTHPAIGVSLGRLVSASDRLVAGTSVALTVHPDMLVIDGHAPARPDASIGELASLFHERLVGVLRIEQGADAEDWRGLLLLLARSAEDLVAEGGLAQAWAATGRAHFEIHEIDYGEVLRERAGNEGVEWDRVVALCLKGESVALDDNMRSALLAAVRDSSKFASILDRLREKAETTGTGVSAEVAALFQLLRTALDAVKEQQALTREEALENIATAGAHLSPEMLLGVMAQRNSANADDAQIAQGIVERMDDPVIASFVARSVAAERGATERLAQAFEALAGEGERKTDLLDLAREEAQSTEFGQDPHFANLWQGAADMLTSYSDTSFVSADYARELSGARTQAIEVERLSDDPPERVQAWLASVNEAAVRQLDLELLLDLLRLESDGIAWAAVAGVAVSETEKRTLAGDIAAARQIAESLAAAAVSGLRPQLRGAAERSLTQLSHGPLVRSVVAHFRNADEAEVEALNAICHAIGPGMVRSLAEALAAEEHNHAIRRVRELLLGFGPAGRQAVEQLKQSSNPAVRRTAIDLLRVFGGDETLGELASMLDDADPQVQRESIRGIVQIGTKAAYEIIERACASSDARRDTLVQQMIGLRDQKAIPPLCHVLNHTMPRGSLVAVHESIIEALGWLNAHPESTSTLRTVLHRSEWWAPFRTASLRTIASVALRRIGTPEALAVLEDAAARGNRGVRKAARAQLGQPEEGARK